MHPICTQNATATAKTGSQHEAFGSKTLVVEHKGLSGVAALICLFVLLYSAGSSAGRIVDSVRQLPDRAFCSESALRNPSYLRVR